MESQSGVVDDLPEPLGMGGRTHNRPTPANRIQHDRIRSPIRVLWNSFNRILDTRSLVSAIHAGRGW